jgi:cytochrome c553
MKLPHSRGLLLAMAMALPGLPAAADPPQQHLAVCVGCHGAGGNSTLPDNPRLAGLAPEYIERQLKQFKSGERASPIMAAIVMTLDANAIRELAEYFSEQKPARGSTSDAGLASKGKLIYDEGIVGSAVPACSSCHGDDGAGDAKYPRLAGQQVAYVEAQLAAFRSGKRSNDVKGLMGAVAKRMSDAEIKAVTQYIAGMDKE